MKASKTLSGKHVVLMGGSGFLGQYVAQALLSRGARLRLVGAHPEKAFRLKPLANLGQIQFLRANACDRSSVERALEGADAVANLVGSFSGDLDRLMGEAPGWMAQAATAGGAGAFVHVSALLPEKHDGIAYAQAKQLGEERVRTNFPQATILRPSALFGPDGGVTNLLAPLVAAFPVLPVFGAEAKLQPAYAVDVAEAIARALENSARHGGKTYELVGPQTLTMLELHRMIAVAQRRKRCFLPMPDGISALFAALPGTPMNRDQWALLKAGNVATGRHSGFKALDIVPKPLGLFLDDWMQRYRKHGRFSDKQLSY